jgi:hypothetical protein
MPADPDSNLLTYLFGTLQEPLVERCARWFAASSRFRAFIAANKDKVRKKVHGIGDSEGMRDLQLELDTAYHLLLDRRFELEYEKYLAGKIRGPDFTVVVKDKGAFNVEVKRLRSAGEFRQWADAICDKLDQMPPSIPNILLVGTASATRKSLDAPQALARLRRLAEANDDNVFTQRGLPTARAYLRESVRLSGVLHCRAWDDEAGREVTLWLNAQAKHALASDEPKALLRCMA